jgi:hypothetical protein
MTTPTPTPEEQNSPVPASEETRPTSNATGFFNRVRQGLKPETEQVHPSEEAEIVIMDEDER